MPHATGVDFVSGDSSGSNEWVRIRDRRTERTSDSRRPSRSGGSDSPSKNGARMSLPYISCPNSPAGRLQPLSTAPSPTIKDPPPSSPSERPVKRVSFSRNPSLRLSTDGRTSSPNISRSASSSSPSSSAVYTPPRYSPISGSRSPMVEYGPAVSDEKTDGPEDITWRQPIHGALEARTRARETIFSSTPPKALEPRGNERVEEGRPRRKFPTRRAFPQKAPQEK
ncbi:hypothetical protein KJ359_002122 [Pestalotiopsis sp. 9143b]|nr:hypothetical protein KJ359_002122 [Pestalotiopsis sp. 9143b]